MTNFDWRRTPADLLRRYDETVTGYKQWERLVIMLTEYLRLGDSDEATRRFLELLDEFLQAVDRLARKSAPCRMFVSHQQADVAFAERIAYLASKEGFDYWLDVHDPLLKLANQTSLPVVVRSVLIAAIIEMALLNCSHAIAVQTPAAELSRWVPYEYGRAKRRWLTSTRVASWFRKGIYESTKADYLKLGVCALSEPQVIAWLQWEWTRCQCPPSQCGWKGGATQPLPTD